MARPGTYSITKYGRPAEVAPASKTLAMLACSGRGNLELTIAESADSDCGDLAIPARCCVSTQGRRIRGPRNPVQVCVVGTPPHSLATRSLWSKSLDRFGSQHVHAPGERRAAPYPPD